MVRMFHRAIGPACRRLAKSAFVAAILAAAGATGCAPQARMVEPGRPADFLPHPSQAAPPGALTAPGHRTLDLGRSADGRPLVMEVFGSGPKMVLFIGGIHGDETRALEVARRLADYLAANPDAAAATTVAVLVNANPDGAARRTRGNAAGVDLNRNFPARNWRPGTIGRRENPGPSPASEVETQAILRAVEMLRPDRIVSLHSTARDQPCNNFDGPAEGLAQLMATHNGYPVLASVGYPTFGSLGKWAGVDRGLPVITLELPESVSGAESWQRNRGALLEAAWAAALPPA
jgi:predicted deacylase